MRLFITFTLLLACSLAPTGKASATTEYEADAETSRNTTSDERHNLRGEVKLKEFLRSVVHFEKDSRDEAEELSEVGEWKWLK